MSFTSDQHHIAQLESVIERLILACGSGMNWMEQVSRASLGTSTRKVLAIDMLMCKQAIEEARKVNQQRKERV